MKRLQATIALLLLLAACDDGDTVDRRAAIDRCEAVAVAHCSTGCEGVTAACVADTDACDAEIEAYRKYLDACVAACREPAPLREACEP